MWTTETGLLQHRAEQLEKQVEHLAEHCAKMQRILCKDWPYYERKFTSPIEWIELSKRATEKK